MSTAVVQVGQFYPAGSSVGAYSFGGDTPPQGPPSGSAVSTATMAADGSATFIGLADATSYFCGGMNGSTWRYVHFVSPSPSGGTVNIGSLPGNPAQEHVTAASPHAARLTDGNAFYKGTTPADTQPVSVQNFPSPQVVSGTVNVGNLPASQTVNGSVSVTSIPEVEIKNDTGNAIPTADQRLPSNLATNSDGGLNVHIVNAVSAVLSLLTAADGQAATSIGGLAQLQYNPVTSAYESRRANVKGTAIASNANASSTSGTLIAQNHSGLIAILNVTSVPALATPALILSISAIDPASGAKVPMLNETVGIKAVGTYVYTLGAGSQETLGSGIGNTRLRSSSPVPREFSIDISNSAGTGGQPTYSVGYFLTS